MHYNVLSYCDFYGSIMSFWVTLIAMAKLREPLRSLAYMIAALCLALGVEYDRHGLWVFVVPVMIGITVMAISWVSSFPFTLCKVLMFYYYYYECYYYEYYYEYYKYYY